MVTDSNIIDGAMECQVNHTTLEKDIEVQRSAHAHKLSAACPKRCRQPPWQPGRMRLRLSGTPGR